ncbi:protein-disulfide reductase DsbD [Chlorobium sp.]|uniref:protein-disulfide reductase DsbD n=1 Tax=Chlorobium sp. TaxID=1095 RepID=UPI0025C64613|nr:protein-disulfide reductase DsbD [Chlorobium sp.]
MFHRVLSLVAVLLSMFFSLSSGFAAGFLDPEDAFRLKAEYTSSRSLVLDWEIAEGYKLYRDQVKVILKSGKADLRVPALPAGERVKDPSTGDESVVYHKQLHVEVPVSGAPGIFTVKVVYQGCSDAGLCYPPFIRMVTVDPAKPGVLEVVGDPESGGFGGFSVTEDAAVDTASAAAKDDDFSLAQTTLESRSLWKISLAFLLFGLLLSFTPCILPMIPILSSIIVGDGCFKRGRSFLLAVAYSLGMALVYTLLGIAAGLAGEGLAGALQQPWVLALFAVLLVVLALSMFDVYQLQIPGIMQSGIAKTCGRLKGGQIAGVFLMGSLSALIVGPCVAAPLAGTLLYISQTRDVVIGGVALFSMAMGMSVPLLLVGLSAGTLLPKAGAWMNGVKYLFGLLLIAVAIWMVSPVIPGPAALLLWGALAILSAVFLHVFDKLPEKSSIALRFGKALGILLLLIGILELAGAASGGDNPLQPLSRFRALAGKGSNGAVEGVRFARIRSEAELDRALASAEKPVMLDFYADWCVSCKELEHFTFSDPEVRKRMESMTLLQVDVTSNSAEDKVLMKRFSIFGPPAIIFFDASGQEIQGGRVVGFIEAKPFIDHLSRYLPGN